MRLLSLVALLAAARAIRPTADGTHVAGETLPRDAPWFCHGIECPEFTVEKSYQTDDGQDIELRKYSSGKWVSTNVSDVTYDKGVRTGFFRLFDYISGANKDLQKIDMTAPVKVLVTPGEGPFCESHFTISFFVPFEFQDKVPEPTNSDVYVDTQPEHSFYVLAYGGFTSENKVLDEATQILKALDDQDLGYDGSYFYSAGYDSPFRLLNRHNEIWIPLK